MENKPSIREERMKAGVEAGKSRSKAWMEAAKAGMEAAAKTSMKPAEAPMESQGWVRRAERR